MAKVFCYRCGAEMLPFYDGAYLFYIAGYFCPKCLHRFRLKKPIYDPPKLTNKPKPPKDLLEKFKAKIREIDSKQFPG